MSDPVVDWAQDTGAPSASAEEGERRVSHKKPTSSGRQGQKLEHEADVKSPVLHAWKGLFLMLIWLLQPWRDGVRLRLEYLRFCARACNVP